MMMIVTDVELVELCFSFLLSFKRILCMFHKMHFRATGAAEVVV